MSLLLIQTSILQGLGKLKVVTVYSVMGIIVKITTNYFLISIRPINIYGAIIGSVLGFSVPIILNHKYMEKVLKQKIRLFRFAKKPLLASICMSAAALIMYNGTSFVLKFAVGRNVANDIAVILAISASE